MKKSNSYQRVLSKNTNMLKYFWYFKFKPFGFYAILDVTPSLAICKKPPYPCAQTNKHYEGNKILY